MDEKDRRYKIVCMATTGWTIIDEHAHNLTKDQCDKWIQDLLKGGANPNYFNIAKDRINNIKNNPLITAFN